MFQFDAIPHLRIAADRIDRRPHTRPGMSLPHFPELLVFALIGTVYLIVLVAFIAFLIRWVVARQLKSANIASTRRGGYGFTLPRSGSSACRTPPGPYIRSSRRTVKCPCATS